jgi:small subunit ribosomal protein S16
MPFSNIIQQNMVVIRLSRAGAKKRPFYHICVSDRRNKRDGRFIERIGFYNPIAKDSEEKIRFDNERYEHWTSVGAKPSDTVLMLLKRSKMTDEEIQKLEDKKTARQEKKKQEKILKQQEEAAKEEAEAPAEEAPAEEAPAEEAPAEEAPAEEAPAEEAPAEEAPAEEAPAEEAESEEKKDQ